jgi:hypothetical protein
MKPLSTTPNSSSTMQSNQKLYTKSGAVSTGCNTFTNHVLPWTIESLNISSLPHRHLGIYLIPKHNQMIVLSRNICSPRI